MNPSPRIVILGAGPAGLGAALGLARKGFSPLVLEARGTVGGNAGSFELSGIPVDYGSHRLHPSTDPAILSELRALMGPDLLERPRHGRILLGGRWIHFPLRPLDLALGAPPSFLLGVAADLLSKWVPGRRGRPAATTGSDPGPHESFASVLEKGLGRTICQEFYFPYARKIWGLEPEEISPVQARKRVASRSMMGMIRRILPGGGSGGRSTRGTFFYPKHGYGQISRALRDAAVAAGAEIVLNARVYSVTLPRPVGEGEAGRGGSPPSSTGGSGDPHGPSVEFSGPGGAEARPWTHLWSTIPITALIRIVTPPAPGDVLSAADGLKSRAMVLVYLVLGVGRFTEFDAHYFPSPHIPFTRLSEPKNYGGRDLPVDRTVLCAEIPCQVGDSTWEAEDAHLGQVVAEGLARAGLPLPDPVLEVATRRLPSAYPLYRKGYEDLFRRADQWIAQLPGVLTFGRQGLFAHDNTHHALFMARAAVDCMETTGVFDTMLWSRYREEFLSHVVED